MTPLPVRIPLFTPTTTPPPSPTLPFQDDDCPMCNAVQQRNLLRARILAKFNLDEAFSTAIKQRCSIHVRVYLMEKFKEMGGKRVFRAVRLKKAVGLTIGYIDPIKKRVAKLDITLTPSGIYTRVGNRVYRLSPEYLDLLTPEEKERVATLL